MLAMLCSESEKCSNAIEADSINLFGYMDCKLYIIHEVFTLEGLCDVNFS